MSQSKRHSFIEAVIGTLIGFVVSMIASAYIYPLHGHRFSFTQTASITAVFTVLSIVRSYLVRRMFVMIHRAGWL